MLTLSHVQSLGDALADACITFKTNEALIEIDRHRENGRWTYRQMRDEARRFGALLQDHEFAAGDRCAIIMQNQSKWIFSAVGALWAGATLMPLDYKLTAPELVDLVAHGKPQVLVTEYSTWLDLQKQSSSALDKVRVLVTEAPEGVDLGVAKRWETVPECTLEVARRTREDVACIVYSSGTSGTPKGCMLTHNNYLEQAQVLGTMYPIDEDGRFFSVLPTNHAIDFMVGFIVPLSMGGAVVHQRTLRPQFVRSTLKEYAITHIALVPTILKNLETKLRERLDELPDWQRTIVDSLKRVNAIATAKKPRPEISRRLLKPIHDQLGGHLKLIVAGGTFVDRGMAEFFYDLGIPIAIGYGLTEACTVITVNDLSPFRADSVGKPVDGVDVEIRDANAEGVGEVWVRGPTVMKGYLDAPELTAEAIVDGWLRTGDLGTVDVAGHLKLVGRAKNMIVTEGGKNIYPEDIETAFDDLPDCEEYCVFAANYVWPKQSMLGEELLVVVRPKGDSMSDELRAELARRNLRLPDFKRLSAFVERTEDFPRTASQKIKRGVLAQQLRALDRETTLRTLTD